jgi:glycerol-3-phosphate acyltransferase PlsY
MTLKIFLLLLAYLLGGIPTGYIIARFGGNMDIRQIGSGNIGTTNVYRALGLRWALVTFLCDTLKGVLPVLVVSLVSASPWLRAGVGLLVVTGHLFSPYLRLRGGKGVATAFGTILYLVPVAAVLDFALWALLAFPLKIISIASLTAAVALPVMVAIFSPVTAFRLLAVCLSILILFSHRENIRRLFRGEEKPLERRKAGSRPH